MIDWDVYEIEQIDNHFRKILHPSVNILFFCKNFEQIYYMALNDEVLLPDIFNDITFYTLNGINAKYKILFSPNEEEIIERLLPQRMRQRARRQEAHNKGLKEYYEFMMEEVMEFVEKYPFWKELIRE